MASYTKVIGDIGVSVITAEFLKHGINVLLPYDDNSPYDIVIYVNNDFYKIQVKTTEQVVENCMTFVVCKTNPYTKVNTLYSRDEIDYFALYCIENNWCGLLTYDDYTARDIRIRTKPPKNNQNNKVKMIDDFNFNDQILKIFNKDLISNNIVPKERKRKKKEYKKKLCPICGVNEIRVANNMCRECYDKSRKKKR